MPQVELELPYLDHFYTVTYATEWDVEADPGGGPARAYQRAIEVLPPILVLSGRDPQATSWVPTEAPDVYDHFSSPKTMAMVEERIN